MKRKVLLATAMSCLFAAPASATVYVLNLTGTVANHTTAFVNAGATRFDFWNLSLDGFSPLTLQLGDQIQATVTFDQSVTMPAAGLFSTGRLFFDHRPQGPLLDSYATTGTWSYSNGGMAGPTQGAGCSSAVPVSCVYDPTGSPITFDSFFTDFTITTATSPFEANVAYFDYARASAIAAVPEPASWALMIAGFGLVGGAMRRRAKLAVTYA